MPESLEEPESPISLSRFNIKPIPPRVQEVYFFGKVCFETFYVDGILFLFILFILCKFGWFLPFLQSQSLFSTFRRGMYLF